ELVTATLRQMAGTRQRCMFCGDSRGTDVDHFRPIAVFRDGTFVWANLVWSCAGCNRAKAQLFAVGGGEVPLLIDPTVDNPWAFLFFESQTGIITARFNAAAGDVDPRGQFTIETLDMNHQAVTEGRRVTQRNLSAAVQAFFDAVAAGTPY